MSRIYKVVTPTAERLVQANTKGQAIAHCVSGDYQAAPIGAAEMLSLMQSGQTVEVAAGVVKPQQPAENQPAPAPEQLSAPLAPTFPTVATLEVQHNLPPLAPAPVLPAPVFNIPVNPVIAEQVALGSPVVEGWTDR